MTPVTDLPVLHPGDGGAPDPFTREWVIVELVPFLIAFLALGVGVSILLFVLLYVYDRLRFDHPKSVSRAFGILWVGLYLLVIGIVFGGGWDKRYHARNPFESFYSAPHLFVYASVGLAILLVVCLVVYYRPLFGSPTTLPYGMPASLGVLVFGLGLTGFAGLALDNVWHTLFGLNETPWSAPHMMIDWGKLVSVLGFGAAALALSRHRAASERHRLGIAYLVVVFSITPFMGPFGQQLTVEQVRAVMATLDHPESGLARAFAILAEWNLVRTNPISVILGAVWAGAAVGFLRPYLARTRALLTVVLAFTFVRARNNVQLANRLGVPLEDPTVWFPLPLIVAVLGVVIVARVGLDDHRGVLVAGGAYSLVMALVWSPTVQGVVVAAPVATVAFVLAWGLGDEADVLVEQPTRRGIRRVAAVAIAVPLVTGVIDLFLRVRMG